jgi:multidrug transporter EmrE-like cation transporter
MKSLLLVVLAIACNAGAQVALKFGATTSLRWQAFLSLPVLAGLLLYGLAFLLTVRIYADYPLSLISPLMAAAIFVLISLAGVLLFGESLGMQKIAGMAVIVLGIGLLATSGS